uniref:Stathmin-4-like isoform 2 n=1 Tax=Acartia pacifica TaxID=335913 RepID=A0A0U2UEN9_ACAPC|nr:stathmin-4-like isoform 2 [Acartia pacifica]
MGGSLSTEKKPKSEESGKKVGGESPEKSPVKKVSPSKKTPEKPVEEKTETSESQSPSKSVEKESAVKEDKPCTPPKPEEVIQVSVEEIASVEAAATETENKEGGLRYDVVLSPAVRTAPKLTPSSSPLTEDALKKKLKEAEERRQSLDNLRMKNLSDQLAKIEIVQQKREDLDAEKKTKAAESLTAKLSTAEENRLAQLKEVKDRLSDHMVKIETAHKELEAHLEAARSAAESHLTEKMEAAEKNRVEEMEEMVKKLKEHQEKIEKVRSNKEEQLKPYVAELELGIKEKLDRAKQLKERHEEQMREKLAEQNRRAELVRQNKERILAEGGPAENQTSESA